MAATAAARTLIIDQLPSVRRCRSARSQHELFTPPPHSPLCAHASLSFHPYAGDRAALRSQRDSARAERDGLCLRLGESEFLVRNLLEERQALQAQVAQLRAEAEAQQAARSGSGSGSELGHARAELSRLRGERAAWDGVRDALRWLVRSLQEAEARREELGLAALIARLPQCSSIRERRTNGLRQRIAHPAACSLCATQSADSALTVPRQSVVQHRGPTLRSHCSRPSISIRFFPLSVARPYTFLFGRPSRHAAGPGLQFRRAAGTRRRSEPPPPAGIQPLPSKPLLAARPPSRGWPVDCCAAGGPAVERSWSANGGSDC